MERAACRAFDGALFFPDADGDIETPLRICAGCPVRAECLDYALESRQRYGIWGGTTERERRRLRHRTA